jgi:hypothetical protein
MPLMRKPRYAAIWAATANIGDDMQTLAAMKLTNASVFLDREKLNRAWRFGGTYRTVMNGWFMYDPRAWPPSKAVDPLFVSFHLTKRIANRNKSGLSPQPTLLSGANLDYFRHHARLRGIGARDLATLRAFQDAGVDAYFSGCLTLTLPTRNLTRQSDSVIAVDLDPASLEALSRRRGSPVLSISHDIARRTPLRTRLKKLDKIVRQYEQAALVVTGRLHAALPCLAFGTPVLFVHDNLDDPRFGGLTEHLATVAKPDFLAGRYDYDLISPPPNGNSWQEIASGLRSRVNDFLNE